MSKGPKRPTHTIKVKEKEGSAQGEVGRAWLNDDGSLSIQLNPGVVLSWNDGLLITAFPRKSSGEEATERES